MPVKTHHLHIGYALVLVAALTLYSGCAGQDDPYRNNDYRYGSDALRMEFLSDNPTTFRDGEKLTLLMELSNQGTYDITDGDLFLSGYDPNFLRNVRVVPDFIHLKGKDEFNPDGELTEIYTIEGNVNAPKNRDRFSQTMQVTACYEYKTKASAEICVDADPYNRRTSNKVCQLGARNYGAQGHPLVVSSIEPIVSGNDIRFNIRVTNSGSGQLFDRTLSNAACNYDVNTYYKYVDRIHVGSIQLSGLALSCEPQNPVRLRNGAGLIVCECRNCVDQTDNAYWSVLDMEFIYGYKNTIQTDLTIFSNN